METAIFWARRARKDIPIGVCGEHAGEPTSIRFFHAINVDYVSCSPFRVPIAKLIAAQAAIEQKDKAEAGLNPYTKSEKVLNQSGPIHGIVADLTTGHE